MSMIIHYHLHMFISFQLEILFLFNCWGSSLLCFLIRSEKNINFDDKLEFKIECRRNKMLFQKVIRTASIKGN